MIFNVTGGGSGTGAALMVIAPAGVTVTVRKDEKTKTKVASSDGIAVFKGLASGMWTVTINDGSQTAQKSVVITADYSTTITFNTIPDFTYTGDYEIVNDADEPITVSQDNWKIRFLTSGTLTFTALNGAENGIDVFLVGGGGNGSSNSGSMGGSGGGGGYTRTIRNIQLSTSRNYAIVVGGAAGATSAFGRDAGAGKTGDSGYIGGNGGSGGAVFDKSPGSDGGDGEVYSSSSNWRGGYGQKRVVGPNGETGTTREFGESGKTLYSTGGYGMPSTATNGAPNTGNGGGGSKTTGFKGGSGIVIIRNKR